MGPQIFYNLINPTDPEYNAVKKPNHKLLPHEEYDVSGKYIGFSQEHNVRDKKIPAAKIDFWLSEAEYAHNESIARCVHATLRSKENEARNILIKEEFKEFNS